MEGHYYTHIGRFLAKHNARLEIDCIPLPTQERQGDEYIMDVVCSPTTTTVLDKKHLKQYTDAEIRLIYYCKNYLQVKRISDLSTADGIFVLPSITEGERSIRQNVLRLNDIRQERPGEVAWKVWRKFLNTLCKEEEGPDKNTMKEKHPIGRRVTKYWDGKPYTGEVTDNEGKYYQVKYDGSNEEELNHTEVTEHLRKNRGEGRTTREVRTRKRLQIKLGDWNITANVSERLWPFYYSSKIDKLYRSYREEWHR
jgi:hypothetical protein